MVRPLAAHDGDAACRGPEPMLDAFANATAGWACARVHLERFCVPPPKMPPNAQPNAWVPAGARMLEALTGSGIDVPHSCCCGLCRVTWTEGEPIHRDRALKPAEREHTRPAYIPFPPARAWW